MLRLLPKPQNTHSNWMRSALARTSLIGLARSMATAPRRRVAAMEVNLAMNLEDAKRYGLEGGFQHSGSSCGRHVEKLYVEGRLQGSLERAATALFDGTIKHALVVSGFYVLHDHLEGATGSCETDGPPGALAVVRALCARGVQTSLYCDAHNGPVLRAGFDAMIAYYATTRPAVADRLRSHCRCVDVPDGVDHLEALKGALEKAWEAAGEVDALVAVERLSEPYRNIRGNDLAAHTEPVDVLWPHVDGTSCGDARRKAGIREDAVSVGIGDGGNEVGLGRVAQLDAVASLSPGEDFCALGVNGALRACDHPLVATVSNWGGSALEAAAHALFPAALDDLEEGVERAVLEAICAAGSVDGKYVERPLSVDGMAWEPVHREFYEMLWGLAKGES